MKFVEAKDFKGRFYTHPSEYDDLLFGFSKSSLQVAEVLDLNPNNSAKNHAQNLQAAIKKRNLGIKAIKQGEHIYLIKNV